MVGFPGAEEIDPNELLTTPCTVLVPAALERVITGENAGKLQCRVLAEGANGPTTPGRRRDSCPAPTSSSSRTSCATPAA